MTDTDSPGATLLRGGYVVDGTGGDARRVDVAIEGDRVVAVGEEGSMPTDAAVVDLGGAVLAPGFIDTHTHFDAQVFWDPDLTPSTGHGVTTVVQGNCGFGIAPTAPAGRDQMMETLENVEGMNVDTLRAGIPWNFETFGEYLDALERTDKRPNVATFIGHTPLRLYVMGLEDATSRAASDDELATMVQIVDDALAAGAMGFSTSRAPNHIGAEGRPVPSRAATRDELVALMGRVARHGRGVVEATFGPELDLDEAAVISRDLGVRITWGSLLTGLHGPPGTALQMLESASALGGDVVPQISCRPIVLQISLGEPYFLGQAPAMKRIFEHGRGERAAVYADPNWRAEVRDQIEVARPGFFAKTSIEESEHHPQWQGIRVDELARQQGVHPFDLMADVALADGLRTRFKVVVHNDDVDELSALLNDDRTVLGVHDAGAHVDMLCDACFPSHLLGHWVRELGVLSLERAIWRLTGQPASVFGFADRGVIRPGALADLVVFDADAVEALPAERVFDFPAGGERLVAGSRGIEHIWINGVRTRANGSDLDRWPGRVVGPD